MFRQTDTCGWNDVSIVRFEATKGYNADEDIEMLAETMNSLSERVSSSVKAGGYGGYSVDDRNIKYYLVQWVGLPWRVEGDQTIVVEDNEYQLYQGEWVCEALWLNNVPWANRWFTVSATKIIVRMKHVLHANVALEPMSEDNRLPHLPWETRRQIIPKGPVKLSTEDHDFMMDEAHHREDFDHEEEMLDVSESEDKDEEEDDEDGEFSDESVSDNN